MVGTKPCRPCSSQNDHAFQSLRGFWVGWNRRRPGGFSVRLRPAVSIPKRVLGWLEHGSYDVLSAGFTEFQSLRGFWVGWNFKGLEVVIQPNRVSIPKRVLGWLEPSDHRLEASNCIVSIPKRVLGWLEQPSGGLLIGVKRFQSLRGFWVGWNELHSFMLNPNRSVSIPKRVLGWLEPRHSKKEGA